MAGRSVVVVGGTRGLGRELAQFYAGQGRDVVVTGRDDGGAEACAAEIGGSTRGIGLDLADPGSIAEKLAPVGEVEFLILAAIERDTNSVKDYDIAAALRLVTLKIVGFTEVVHTLLPRLGDDSAVLLYGGLARDRPYPGSTTVTTVNGAVTGLVRTLVVELAPRRVNALHPAIVGDSPSGATCRRSASTRSSRGRRSGASSPWPRSSTHPGSCSRTAPSTGSTCRSTAGGSVSDSSRPQTGDASRCRA
jgi:NAD(P)-dependent dehydrogenase (short-subunit alcohol dehydrogenase family)